MKSPNIRYIPEIDHLRAYAALLIFFYHGAHLFSYHQRFHASFTFDNWLQTRNIFFAAIVEGHTAVALFMVLSGFIFTYGSFGKQISYWRFIGNRFLRTYPLFILLLFVGIYSYPARFSFSAFLQTLFGLANAAGSLNLGSFSAMFWPIAVEWHFYLIFPFLFAFAHTYGWRYLIGLIAVCITFRILAYAEGANIRDLSYWTIAGRIDQFLIGMLTGVAFQSYKIKQKTATLSLSLLAAILIVSLYIFHRLGGWPYNSFYKMFWPTYEGVVWGAIIFCYIKSSIPFPKYISKAIIFVGTISYSFYLIHFVIITALINREVCVQLSDNSNINSLLTTFFFALPITILVSTLTYTFVEKPFLNLRLKYLQGNTPLP
jgi:peptidoglycan/LPS O-acetylase OafA/YrhL